MHICAGETLVHFFIINPRRMGGGLQYLVGLCVCMSVCLLPQNCCLSSIISKSEHATALNLCKELAILLFYRLVLEGTGDSDCL